MLPGQTRLEAIGGSRSPSGGCLPRVRPGYEEAIAAELAAIFEASPFISTLKLEVLEVDHEKSEITLRMPLNPGLERRLGTKQFHGGPIASFIDTTGDFAIGIMVPVAALSSQGALSQFNKTGLITATGAGALGAIGAACIIWAFRTGGLPVYVMPLVFGGAPIVNVLITMLLHARGHPTGA